MSYLKMALQTLKAATVEGRPPEEQMAGIPGQAPDHPPPCPKFIPKVEPASPPERILTCAECPWYAPNPWTHYPELSAWCHYHMDGILKDNPACISYRRGGIAPAPGKEKRT